MSDPTQRSLTILPPEQAPVCGGKRLTALMPAEPPLISIVTVVFNRAKDLERTIESVASQLFEGTEFIIVDGGSTDSTVEVLKKYEDSIDYWISEPDHGIYDAINKACRLIRGEWMLFLGGGDRLHDCNVLEKAGELLKDVGQCTEIAYGRTWLLGDSGVPTRVWNKHWVEMRGHWETGRPILPQHQGVFHRKRIISGDAPFDTSYSIAADSKLLLKSIKRVEPVFLDVVVTDIQLGGVSTDPKNSLRMAKEVRRLTSELGYQNVCHQVWTYAKALVKVGLYRLAGGLAARYFIDLYRAFTGRSRIWNIR